MKYFLLLSLAVLLNIDAKCQSEQDIASVRKVVISFQDDFNDGGFKNADKYTTEDWEHINPLGGIDKGRANVLKVVISVHQTFLKGVTMKIESMNIRFITPDVALADVVHLVSSFTTPDGIKHDNERNIKTYVMVKKAGTWLLTLDHNTIIQPGSTVRVN